jgi:hypothetical protein
MLDLTIIIPNYNTKGLLRNFTFTNSCRIRSFRP